MPKKSKLNSIQQRPQWEDKAVPVQASEYDATKDPYCPFTRTDSFKQHMEYQQKNQTTLLSKSLPNIATDFSTTMKTMERPYGDAAEKFPKHTVPNTSIGTSGLTFSAEPNGNAEESIAELEVLKAILNREAYLARLVKDAATVSRKFKPEIADVLDLVRASTLDVVESIVKWREAKVFQHLLFDGLFRFS